MSFGKFKAQKPPRYNEKSPVKEDGQYKFSRSVNRIYFLKQIKPLFDNPREVKEETRGSNQRHYGTISGIEVRIDFNPTSSCSLHAKTEEDLGRVYREVIRALT